jgi:hypothetical protein
MKSRSLQAVLLTFPLFFIYYLTANQIFSFDAITNAIAAESNEPIRWFHANHPLYPALGVAWFRLERLLGYSGFAIYSFARFNSLLVSAGCGILFLSLARRISSAAAASSALFLAFCFGVWAYAVDGRAIGASFFFGCLVLAAAVHLSSRRTIKVGEGVLLGVLSSLYVLVHGIAIFHIPALFIFLWLSNIPLVMYTTSSLSILLLMGT